MTATKTKRVLSLSTLFPNAAHPRFGIFVAKSSRSAAAGNALGCDVGQPDRPAADHLRALSRACPGRAGRARVRLSGPPPRLPLASQDRRPAQPAPYRAFGPPAGAAAACRKPVRPRGRAILLSRWARGNGHRQRSRPALIGEGARRGYPFLGRTRIWLPSLAAHRFRGCRRARRMRSAGRRHGDTGHRARSDHDPLHRARPGPVSPADRRAGRGWRQLSTCRCARTRPCSPASARRSNARARDWSSRRWPICLRAAAVGRRGKTRQAARVGERGRRGRSRAFPG